MLFLQHATYQVLHQIPVVIMHVAVHLTPTWMKQQTLPNVQHAQMEVQQIQLEDLHPVVSVQVNNLITFNIYTVLISIIIYVILTVVGRNYPHQSENYSPYLFDQCGLLFHSPNIFLNFIVI